MSKQQVIGLTRFSPRPKASECRSCEDQERRIRKHAEASGRRVRAIYHDPKASGGIFERSGLQAALNALKPGDVLLVDSSDRLARDMLVFLTIKQEVQSAGATIEYVDGPPPATTPEGELYENILVSFAQYERSRIRYRTKRGLDRKRQNGERTTGRIPIGWMKDPKDPKRLVRCEQERQAIQWACICANEDKSSAWIADFLETVVGKCRGHKWSPRTVRKIIAQHGYWASPAGDPALEPQHP